MLINGQNVAKSKTTFFRQINFKVYDQFILINAQNLAKNKTTCSSAKFNYYAINYILISDASIHISKDMQNKVWKLPSERLL